MGLSHLRAIVCTPKTKFNPKYESWGTGGLAWGTRLRRPTPRDEQTAPSGRADKMMGGPCRRASHVAAMNVFSWILEAHVAQYSTSTQYRLYSTLSRYVSIANMHPNPGAGPVPALSATFVSYPTSTQYRTRGQRRLRICTLDSTNCRVFRACRPWARNDHLMACMRAGPAKPSGTEPQTLRRCSHGAVPLVSSTTKSASSRASA